MTLRLLVELVVVVLFLALVLEIWRTRDKHNFSGIKNVAEAVFHISAAIAIVASGLWIVFQRDWAPRASVEVGAAVTLLSPQPATALIHVRILMRNQGRLPYKLNNVRFAVRGYDLKPAPNEDGDLAERTLGTYASPHYFSLAPGEADEAYAEFGVPCSERAVQVLVKVEEPGHVTRSYERKMVVRLSPACDSSTASTTEPSPARKGVRGPR